MLKKPTLFSHRSETRRTARVRLASSLAAAALNGLFEHPAGATPVVGYSPIVEILEHESSLNTF
jgi:hypothetical protein